MEAHFKACFLAIQFFWDTMVPDIDQNYVLLLSIGLHIKNIILLGPATKKYHSAVSGPCVQLLGAEWQDFCKHIPVQLIFRVMVRQAKKTSSCLD